LNGNYKMGRSTAENMQASRDVRELTRRLKDIEEAENA
jgi:hypothetical protein